MSKGEISKSGHIKIVLVCSCCSVFEGKVLESVQGNFIKVLTLSPLCEAFLVLGIVSDIPVTFAFILKL